MNMTLLRHLRRERATEVMKSGNRIGTRYREGKITVSKETDRLEEGKGLGVIAPGRWRHVKKSSPGKTCGESGMSWRKDEGKRAPCGTGSGESGSDLRGTRRTGVFFRHRLCPRAHSSSKKPRLLPSPGRGEGEPADGQTWGNLTLEKSSLCMLYENRRNRHEGGGLKSLEIGARSKNSSGTSRRA